MPVVMSPLAMSPTSPVLSPPINLKVHQDNNSNSLTLTFAKVAISPYPSTSTDSEVLSDDHLSRSPSLLTSLIRCNRSTSGSGGLSTGTTGTGGLSSGPTSPLPRARPILRRCSSTDPDRHLAFEQENVIQRKRSCLKFAVTPRPQHSASSSRRSSAKEEEVATPWTSDDAGYQEDSEDGFTSDEDFPVRKWEPSWTPAVPPAPILSTRRKHAAPIVESTDDCLSTGPRRRKIRLRADDEDRKCSRHRSPPPSSGTVPPPARSPSAFDLCRRRPGGSRSDDTSIRRERESLAPCRVTFQENRAVFERRKSEGVKRKRSIALVRRDSAPACVDEVHVLALQSHEVCPVRGLRRVLGR